MKTAVGLFDTLDQAQVAWQALIDAGISEENLSLIAHSGDGVGNPNDNEDKVATGAAGGAVLGGALGVLAGLAAFAIPGVGPALAIGPLVGGIVGAGAGALSGGLVGSLVEAGVAEEDAAVYWEGVRRGGALVVVNTHGDRERSATAADILNRNGAVDIKERGAAWRSEGWEGYNPDADPYSSDQLRHYRQSGALMSGAEAHHRDVTENGSLVDHELDAAEMSGQYVDYMKMGITGERRDDLDHAHNFEPSGTEPAAQELPDDDIDVQNRARR